MEHAKKTNQSNESKAASNQKANQSDSTLDQNAVLHSVQNPTVDTLTPSVIQSLQRTQGNQFVLQLMREANLPSKKTIQRTPDEVWNHLDTLPVDKLTDEDARRILKMDFFSNWFIAQKYLVSNEWDDVNPEDITTRKKEQAEKLMRRLLDLREKETNKLLEHIRATQLEHLYPENPETQEKKKYSQMSEDEKKGVLKWSAAGSETLTSDIDVNLKGSGSTEAVTLFNSLFKSYLGWSLEAGTVYDVNVYAQDFMTTKPFEQEKHYGDNEELTGITLVPGHEEEIVGDMSLFDDQSQDVWSYVKMITYMSDEEWQNYKKQMATQVPAGVFAAAEELYKESSKLIHDKIDEINENADHAYDSIHQTIAAMEGYMGEHNSEHYAEASKKMMAANLIYQEKLDRVAGIRFLIQEIKNTPESVYEKNPQQREFDAKQLISLAADLKLELSKAIVFANEAYLTQGAVHFVVVGQQIGGDIAKEKGVPVDIQLSDEELIHALREQVGDSLKVLSEYSRSPIWKAAYKAGKYIDRMVKSGLPLLGDQSVKDLQALQTIGALAVQYKSNGGVGAEEGLGKALSEQGVTSIDKLRSMIVAFSVDVEKSHKVKQDSRSDETDTEVRPEPPSPDNPVGQIIHQNIEQQQEILTDLTKVTE